MPGNNQTRLSAQQLLSCEMQTQRGCKGGDIGSVWWYIEQQGLFDENACASKYRAFVPIKIINQNAQVPDLHFCPAFQ